MTRRTVLIPRIRVSAWDGNPHKRVPQHAVLPLEEALYGRYEGEACFVAYAPPEGTVQFPRLTKASLTYFLTRPPDERPTIQVVPVDVDYGNHEVPPADWHTELVAKVPFDAFGWYRTPHGCRLVFLPKEPLPLHLADSYIAQLHERLNDAGIETDLITTDWTRLQKLPHALGLTLPKDLSGLAPLSWEPEELEHAEIHRMGKIVERDQPRPNDIKLTKSKMHGLPRQLIEDLYAERLSANEGERHATFLATALEITSTLETNDPIVPYEMLLGSWHNVGKGADELWRLCEWAAATFAGAEEQEEEVRLSLRELTAEAMGCHVGEVNRRLVIDTGKEFFVWDEQEMAYSHAYTSKRQLLGACDQRCPQLMAYPEKDEDVFRDYMSVAQQVVYSYDQTRRGFHPDTGTLYIPVCGIDPLLEPEFNPDIHAWLGALVDGPHFEEAMDWFAQVPNTTEPLCALYINGPRQIGKGMLTAGMARLFSRQMTVTPYEQLISEFNPTLLESPIVVADEKVPTDAFRKADSATFRKHLGGQNVTIRDLYKSPATLMGCPRILITANNDSALQIQEDLTPDDLDAIRERIGYINTDTKPREVLHALAEEKEISVPDMCKPWIEGGGIARHILYLFHNRKVKGARRFMVEGWESDLTKNLPTKVGVAPAIGEVIALAIANDHLSDAVRWFGGKIYVSNQLLAREWSDIYGHDKERMPKSTSRQEALQGMSTGRHRMRAAHDTNSTSNRWYYIIDAERIAHLADRMNICSKAEIFARIAREDEEQSVVFDLTSAEPALDSSPQHKEEK